MQNHFELFQLPQRYAVDAHALDNAYRDVQSRVHPDKFVNATDAEKRVAMQWATRANEAYQTLKNPQKRAQYLCELHGVELQRRVHDALYFGGEQFELTEVRRCDREGVASRERLE